MTVEGSLKQHGFYQHSGQMTAYGPLLVVVGGVVSALILGFLYMALMFYIPYLIAKWALMVGMTAGLSFVIAELAKVGKIRSPLLVLVLGGLIGTFAWYCSWVSLYQIMVEGSPFEWNPLELFVLATHVGQVGRWEDIGPTATWCLWGAEALALIGAAAVYPWDSIRDTPFCEACDRWVKAETQVGPFEPEGNVPALKHHIEGGNLSRIMDLTPAQTAPFWLLKLLYCDQCNDLYLANLMNVQINGEGEAESSILVRNFHISREQYDQLWEKDKPAELIAGSPETVDVNPG